jgi:hypothetical protein
MPENLVSSLAFVILQWFSEAPERVFLELSNLQATTEGKLSLISWGLKEQL